MALNLDEDDQKQPPQPGTILPVPKNLAVELIRSKLDNLYEQEPDAEIEEAEVLAITQRSKHQQFMYELTTSGKDLVQIQTEWHHYYQKLPDDDKKKVWQEFYDSNKIAAQKARPNKITEAQAIAKHVEQRAVNKPKPRRSAGEIRQSIATQAHTKTKLSWKQHLQSMLFGLSLGMIVVFVLLFSFFNEVIIAPFIQPSRHDTATPIILSSQSAAPTKTPEVIIPKINVEIPITYNIPTTNENVIENFLQDGVIHYPGTSVPGQNGNASYFGHSSNNILNPGQYKFAFVLLHDLVKGDVFYLTYNEKVYAYKVFYAHIVTPSDVSVLNPTTGHPATATLITCDPPGTSLNRLVVVGDQISPAPNTNTTSQTTAFTTSGSVKRLPNNGPSLWQRFISTNIGKASSVVFILVSGWIVWRWLSKEFRSRQNS